MIFAFNYRSGRSSGCNTEVVLGLPVRRLSADGCAGFVLKLDKHSASDDRAGIPNVLKQTDICLPTRKGAQW